MRKFLNIIIFLTLYQFALAQTEFGIVAGINAASQKVSYSQSMRISTNGPISLDVNSIKTFHAGIVVNVRLDKRIDLKGALMYNGKGQYERVTRIDIPNSGFSFRDNINYAEVPVSLVIDLGMEERKGAYFTTGLYFAQAIGGKSHFENYDINYSFDPEVVITKTVDNWEAYTLYVKKNDFGLHNGIGYRFGRITAEISNEIGLVNNIPYINNADPLLLSSVSNENTRKNLTWGLRVTYLPFRIQSQKSDSIKLTNSSKRTTWNINAGLTINTFAFSGDSDLSTSLSDGYTNQLGYQIGVGGIIPIKGRLSLKPELKLITRGGAYEGAQGEGKVHEKLTYLSVPVLLSVGINKLSIDFGPSVGFQLSSRLKNDAGTIEYNFFDESFDFGVNLGVDFSMTTKFSVFTRYYLGIASVKNLLYADQFNNKTEVDYLNRSLEIGLTYQLR